MRVYRFLALSVFIFCLCAKGVHAFAQDPPGQWVGDLYSTTTYPKGTTNDRVTVLLEGEDDIVHKRIPNLSIATDAPIPPEYRTYSSKSYWYRGAMYEFAYGEREINDEGLEFRRHSLAKWEDDEWHFLGEYISYNREIFKVIPCDNDRFIVISSDNDLTGNKGPDRSPFVRMSIHPGKKELRIDASIDHGQDGIRKYMSDPDVFFMVYCSVVVITEKHATLVNRSTGLYWVFSLEKASLIHTGNIFKQVTPEMIAKGGFPHPIFCINPEKDGTVLISSEEEYFFLQETGNLLEESNQLYENNPGITHQEVYELMRPREQQLMDNSPFIAWYRIYPETGKVEKLRGHPEGGSDFRKDGHIWRPMPDGSVKMMWTGWHLDDKVEKGQLTPTVTDSTENTEEQSQSGESQKDEKTLNDEDQSDN